MNKLVFYGGLALAALGLLSPFDLGDFALTGAVHVLVIVAGACSAVYGFRRSEE